MILFRAFRRRAPIVYDTRGARQVVRVRYRPHEQPEWAHGTHRRFSSGLGRYSGRRVDATVTTDGGLVIKRTNWSYAGPVLLATSTVTTWDVLSHIRRSNVCQHCRQQPSRNIGTAVSWTPTNRWLCSWRHIPCHLRSDHGRVSSRVSQGGTWVCAASSWSAPQAMQTTTCRSTRSPSARSGSRCIGTADASSACGPTLDGHVVCGDPTACFAKHAGSSGFCTTRWFARIGQRGNWFFGTV